MSDPNDWSKAVRGKFAQQRATMQIQVCLNHEVSEEMLKRALSAGREVEELVNELLEKELQLVKPAEAPQHP
jgi:hypothetical protein